jgi:hypothetical protein
MEVVVVVAVIALAAAGFAIRRGWALVLPAVVVPVLYLGAQQGWWGHGLGDGWYFAMMLVFAVAVAVTAAAILLGRLSRL